MAKKKKPATKKKKTSGRSSYIAKAPIRRLMKSEGAKLVAETAVIALIEKLTKLGTSLTKSAITYVKSDKRKRITGNDIVVAQRML